jgi:putative ABC transport system permease protein
MLFRLGAVESSMDREMRAHIEFEARERMRLGWTADEAYASARRDFGAIELHKEEARDARGTRAAEDFIRDTRHAARTLRRNPAFALTATLTFALGTGAATAIFSVVYGVLMRPLPYAEPARLAVIWEHHVRRGDARNVVALQNFEDWRRRSRSFESMAAIVPNPVTLPGAEGPERVSGAEVTPGYFTMLGVRPALGRDFVESDVPSGGRAVILSDAYWRTRLGADPDVLSRTLSIGGEPFEVVGVMPPDFDAPAFGWLGGQSLWMPLVPTPQKHAWGRFLLVVGRLRAGTTVEAAGEEMRATAQRLAGERASNRGWSASVVALSEQLVGHTRTSLSYILATVLLLLALAVANVGTLILAHTHRRLHEFGVRRVIGASDSRIFRQVLTESLLLGFLGCAAGITVAYPTLDVLMTLLPADLPRQASIRIDAPVLGAAAAVSLLAALAFGVIGARRGRSAPSVLLAETTQRGSARAGGRSLVIAEVAIGLVVAVLASLMMRSLIGLQNVDLGFSPGNTVVGRVAIGAYQSEESRRAFLQQLLDGIRVQGIRDVGIVTARPLSGLGPATTVVPTDAMASADSAVADVRWADAGFFRTLGVRLTEGEWFGAADGPGDPVRAVITQSMARALWGGESAVGRRLRANLYDGLEATVAGVIDDVHLFDPRTPPRPAIYLSSRRFTGEVWDIVARAGSSPAEVVSTLRGVLGRLDARIPLHRVETMDALVASTLATDRFLATLLASFAILGLALAGVGIYGVFAGDVAARTREMGIRLALGAPRIGVLAMILRRAVTNAAIGVLLGLAGAAIGARSFAPLLFGITATDVVSFMLPAVILLILAATATAIPAIRASRVSPNTILRSE